MKKKVKITILPNKKLCPKGIKIYGNKGENLCDVLIKNNIKIKHACEKSCACATCHVIIIKGYKNLNKIKQKEIEILENAWGYEKKSRLSCQVFLNKKNIKIKIPKYN
ncbi:putative ferredoxin, 2Fe-2S type, ISC system [Candidatus Zinderia insecticola CARI]|uniref:2Fe-2S ferredoxin n=1 Tax=Zinderia insecticola (strain CARI) TaxID=871271 RepID=E0TIS7_ZINIC|nr:putative ferredoxin, 2Fe-2S type, ISC system [Candidatus Zinderia insecticola CARI]